jgi:FkbM family methyltransferase
MYARGARDIVCYEPEPGNYVQLRENVGNLAPHVRTCEAAVWRSDRQDDWLRYVPSEVVERTGGGHVFGEAGKPVATVPFDLAVATAAVKTGRVDLVKLDCEGSEWPILLTSKSLSLVRSIIGEFHEIGGPNMDKVTTQQTHPRTIPACARVGGYEAFTLEVLGRFLARHGFTTEAMPTPGHEWIGKFWAKRV